MNWLWPEIRSKRQSNNEMILSSTIEKGQFLLSLFNFEIDLELKAFFGLQIFKDFQRYSITDTEISFWKLIVITHNWWDWTWSWYIFLVYIDNWKQLSCLRPYQAESTGSRPISEVKQLRAGLVLGRETTWEPPVL